MEAESAVTAGGGTGLVYGSSAGQQTNEKTQQKLGFFSVPGGIRTCDLRFRKPTLYPAELRGHAHCLDAQSTLTDYEFQLPILCLRSRTERPSSGFTSTPQKPSLTDQREVRCSPANCISTAVYQDLPTQNRHIKEKLVAGVRVFWINAKSCAQLQVAV